MIINEQNMARGLKKESLNNKGLRFIMQKKISLLTDIVVED